MKKLFIISLIASCFAFSSDLLGNRQIFDGSNQYHLTNLNGFESWRLEHNSGWQFIHNLEYISIITHHNHYRDSNYIDLIGSIVFSESEIIGIVRFKKNMSKINFSKLLEKFDIYLGEDGLLYDGPNAGYDMAFFTSLEMGD